MSFTKLFGQSALGALRGLAKSSKAVLKGKQVASESSASEHLQHVLTSSVKPRFVVLVFIHYTGWYCGSRENPQSMQLDSVRNDFIEVLKYLRYRHDDEKTMWCLLTDLDLEYTDEVGNVKLLPTTYPTREAILNALTEAGETRGSGLVYFGAHGEYGLSGTSDLQKSGERTYYSVNVQPSAESKSSFLIAIDGGRIYGEDIFSRLPEDIAAECVHTVALDTCSSGGLAEAAKNLCRRYDGKRMSRASSPEVPPVTGAANAVQRSSKQLVIISAAREGEMARAVRPGGKAAREHGRLTWYMIHWLEKHPNATAQNLAERLRYRLTDMAPEGEKQHPVILARYSLTDSFELLPGLQRRSQDESRSVRRLLPLLRPLRPPLTIRWFRPPLLASGRRH